MAYLSKPVEREALDGAFGSIHGFIDRKVKNLLIVEDDDVERESIVELIGNGDVQDDRRRDRRRGAGGAGLASSSTAWCSTSASTT